MLLSFTSCYWISKNINISPFSNNKKRHKTWFNFLNKSMVWFGTSMRKWMVKNKNHANELVISHCSVDIDLFRRYQTIAWDLCQQWYLRCHIAFSFKVHRIVSIQFWNIEMQSFLLVDNLLSLSVWVMLSNLCSFQVQWVGQLCIEGEIRY